MEKIKKILVTEILNSRSEKTIKVTIFSDNFRASFSVPQGKSKGKYEAVFLSSEKAKEIIEEVIFPKIKDSQVDFQKIDQQLINFDGTSQKKKLGANSILGVSVAVAKLQAKAEKKPIFEFLSGYFPKNREKSNLKLLMNLINGGVHTKGGVTFQEYLVILDTKSLSESVFLGSKIYRELGKILNSNIGDEGGYVFGKGNSIEPLKILKEIIEKENLSDKVLLGLDLASSQFFDGKEYKIDNKLYSKENLLKFYLDLFSNFGLLYLEDPFEENDFESFSRLNEKIKEKCLVVGDDLTVTNKERLEKAIENQSISGIIVKPNQIGSLSETIEVINLAKKKNIEVIISHRSGETNDSFIADLAVACGAWGIKTGAPARGERVAKYNRLIEIENYLKSI